MTQITSQILEQISEIIRPFALTASERQAMLVKAFGADSRADRLIGSIDLSSATSNFTALLIRRLVDYGEFDPGQPALTVLLLTIRADVGSDKQSEIDTLLAGLYKNGEAPTLDARDHYAPPSGEHVFISYSRADKHAVLQFIADVEKRGVRVWVDASGLTPGTPDWEQALRDAIRGSRAVILAASPDSRRSAYVKDEIRIAQMYKRPIYPVWVNGDEWMDSIPMGLGGVQFVDVRGDTYATGVAEIARSLAGVAPLEDQSEGEQTDTELVERDPVERNPYKGLQAFTADDTRYFFGRDKLVDELVAALDDTERFLPVIGASGSGKSSVVMAGLLPRLQAEHDDWTFLKRVVPGTHPLEALANTLAAAIPGALGTVVLDSLTKDASNRSLHVLAAQISHTRAVLFVDQFEELFTVSDPLERDRFLELLMVAATEPNGPLLVIFTMRADFMDRPLGDDELARLFQDRSVLMKPMDVGDLRDVIVKPAALQGLTFDENLVGDLLFEVRGEVGALPLLEFALLQLYEARDGNRLTRAAYDDIGGVRGAIAAQAEATYLDLPSERHRRLGRALFLRLIEPGATEQDTTRRRIGRNELTLANAEDTAVMQEVADAFTGARLLVSDEDTLEVAHEALIREWDRLKLWLNEARDDLRLQKKVNAEAADWVRAGRPDNYGGFYTGTLLIDAQTWASHATLSQDEAAFIAASNTADETRREKEEATARRVRNFRRASVVLGVVVVLALGATILAGLTALTARDESNTAQTAQAVANADRATATVSQGEALNEVNRAATQVAAAENAAATAIVAQGLAIADAENAVNLAITATIAQGEALNESNRAATQVAGANEQLAAVPPTLTQVAQLVQDGENRVESLRLASEAVNILNDPLGNPEVAALLGIRALQTGYTAQADAALVRVVDNLYTRQTFSGHTNEVTSVAFSPDGRYALSGSGSGASDRDDDTVRLWEVASGEQVRVFSGHTSDVTSVAFSPDGRYALSGSWDTTVRLWEVASGEQVRVFSGHMSVVSSVAFSPDGRYVLSGSGSDLGDDDTTVRLWEVASGEQVHVFSGHTVGVESVAFSPDGRYVLSGSDDHTLRLWEVESGEQVRVFSGHMAGVQSVAFSSDGRYALSGSWDNTLRLWEVESGEQVRVFSGHTNGVQSVAFSPDGRYVLSGSMDRTVRLWEVESGTQVRVFIGHMSIVRSVAFSPDGRYVLSGSWDNTLRLWSGVDTLTSEMESGEQARVFSGHTGPVESVAFSPDRRYALSGSGSFRSDDDDNTVRLWEVASGAEARVFSGHTDLVNSVAFSPDGRYALSGSRDGTVRLWEVASGAEARVFSGHTDDVNSVAFSLDGRYALSGSDDTTLRLWDAETGEEARVFSGHTDWVNSVAFSLDGRYVLSGSSDNTLRLWDAETGEEARVFSGHTSSVLSVAFSPDGRYVLSGSSDNTLRLWDAETGEEARVFSGHTSSVLSVAFSPDGRYALSGSFDNTLRLWDAESGEQVRVFSGHTDLVNSVAFSPDGRYALSGSSDTTVRLWDTDYRDFISYACTRIFRDFTDFPNDERNLYGITDDAPTCPQFAGQEVGSAP